MIILEEIILAIQTVPYALQNGSHSAALFRQSASAAFHNGGVLTAGEMIVTQQGTPNMSVVLGPGRAKVPGNAVSAPGGLNFTTQAMYDVLNDAATTLTVAASDPVNPRYDLVYLATRDAFYSGALNQAVALIATGTPAVSPVTPALPLNAIAVSLLVVAANSTAIVSANISAYGYPASIRGAIAVASTYQFYPPAPFLGQYVDDPAIGLLRYGSSGWAPVTDRYMELTRLSSYTMTANSTNYVLGGGGATIPFFNAPTASSPLNSATSVFQNELFVWNPVGSQLSVKVSGIYEIEMNVSANISGSGGASVIGVAKNQNTLDATANTLARCDGANNSASALYLKARNPGVFINSTDTLYLIGYMAGVTGSVVLGANPMDGSFRIRKMGI